MCTNESLLRKYSKSYGGLQTKMRFRMLVGVCLAAVLVLALAATAWAQCSLNAPTTVTSGETIHIEVSGTEKGLSAVIATTGLEFVEVDGGLSSQDMVLLLGDIGGMKATYTYKVTAAAGQGVSFALTDVTESDGTQDIYEPAITWSGMVGGSFTTTEEPTTAPTATQTAAATVTPTVAPTSTPTVTATVDAAGAISATPIPTDSVGAVPTNGPKTGDSSTSLWVLWLIAIAAAAACVFAGRKIYKARQNK